MRRHDLRFGFAAARRPCPGRCRTSGLPTAGGRRPCARGGYYVLAFPARKHLCFLGLRHGKPLASFVFVGVVLNLLVAGATGRVYDFWSGRRGSGKTVADLKSPSARLALSCLGAL